MVYYHELSRILGDTSATGKLAHPSTKSPSESSASSDPECKVMNEDLDTLQIDSDNDNGDGQGKCKGKSKMAGKKSKKMSSFQANISEGLKEMSENSKRNVDLMEKRLTNASVTNVGYDSGSIEGGSTASRSLLKECMALLHAMEEIHTPLTLKKAFTTTAAFSKIPPISIALDMGHKSIKSHAKRFRKKGMVYYHELSRILGDTSATSKLAHPSTKSPSESSASSDPEFKCKGKSKMAGKKSKKMSSFQANISEALKEMSENSKRNVDLMEKRLTNASVTNVGYDSGSIEGGSTASRSLLKECMALLHAMEEIHTPAYTKVMNKLASDPIIRDAFVNMPAGKMRDWVLNL
ncbi:hypothetical protein TEA_013574 [Camellia sinensis var. sinensis]|uniref:Uncharacterized protein n=1 Tax=Camellia sinensis var. sinensis TaxID=542762 RepID=A0A4S4D0H4_CAMSN|nr:hypothetical protein TEA_013574 [Camellia sinensis var. sinensis]